MSSSPVIRSRDIVSLQIPSFTAVAEPGQLRFFADSIGEEDPVYFDIDAARALGYANLPVPPTFLFSLEGAQGDRHRILRKLGVELRQVLHGEQGFTYYRVAVAGEELLFEPRIRDYYEKRDGALRFLVLTTRVTSAGEAVAELRNVLVIRELELA